jgi:DNA-binding NarL/FixJ family response regulator
VNAAPPPEAERRRFEPQPPLPNSPVAVRSSITRRSSRISGSVTTLSPSDSRFPARLDTASHKAGGEGAFSTVIRVVLCDDSFLAREGIARVLESIEDVELVASCVELDELRAAVEREKPDVVLTDIRMPPTNTDEGIRFALELRSSHPAVGVVVLSQHADPSYAMALFSDGSERRGYLLKERVKDEDELVRALHEVVAGGSLVDPRIVDKRVSARVDKDPGLERLTPRERQILAMIAEGRSNNAIADRLMVTKRAVERHINGIFLKLDLGEASDVNRRVKAALLYLTGEEEG